MTQRRSLISSAGLRHDNVTGIFWVLAAALFFSVMVVAVKIASDDGVSTLNIAMARCVAGIPLAGLVALALDRKAFYPNDLATLALRGVLNVSGQLLALYSFTVLHLVLANAISFTRPIFVLIFAVLLLGETIGVRRIVSVIIGFAGVFVMLEPWNADLYYSWLGIGAVVLGSVVFAFSIILVRSMSANQSNTALVLWSSIFTTLILLPFWWWFYEPILLSQVPILIVIAFFGVVAQALYVQGLRSGEASVVNIVDYSRLIFVALLAYFFLEQVPRLATIIGSLIVAGSAIYIAVREAQLKKNETS